MLQIVGVLVGGALIAWLRMPAGATDIVYAEDGRVFLGEYESLGFWRSLFNPYTGYLQFWPRAIVGVIRATQPLDAYAFALVLVCAVFVGSITALAFSGAAAISDWLPWRLGVAATTVLMPTAPIEASGNVANLHWYVLWGSIWLVLAQPRSRWGAIALAALAASFSLTEIQTALLVPLFIIRLRDRRRWVIRLGLIVGLACQFVGYAMAPRSLITAHPDKLSLVAGWLLDVPTAVFTSAGGVAGPLIDAIGWPLGVLALAVPTGALAVVLRWGDRSTRTLAVCLMFYAVAIWFAAVWANTVDNGDSGFDVHSATTAAFVRVWFSPSAFVPSRYSVVPSMCLAALVLLAAVTLRRHRPRATIAYRAAPIVAVALVLVLSMSFVAPYSTRDGGPSWSSEVVHARQACAASDAPTITELATAPAGWAASVPCAALAR